MFEEPKKSVKDTSKLNILREIIKEQGLPLAKESVDSESKKNEVFILKENEDIVVKPPSGMRQFSSGAVRNDARGKGRFDLIPPSAMRRVARVYEHGAEKMGANNWTLGMPFSVLIDSATRHLNDWRYEKLMGIEPTEDHLGHAVWNILAIMHFEDTGRTELDDLWKVGKPLVNSD